MSLERRMHETIRAGRGTKDKVLISEEERVPGHPDLRVSFVSVLKDAKGSFRRGVYAIVGVEEERFNSDSTMIEALGIYIAERFLRRASDVPGLINMTESLHVESSEYELHVGRVKHPILRLSPAINNPGEDMKDANN